MTVTIQHRRKTAAEWVAQNPILKAGQFGLETDTRRVKFGDGVTPWAGLGYAVGDGDSTTTPGDYASAVHGHGVADISGLQGQLDGKAPASHTHPAAQVTGLDAAIDARIAAVGGGGGGATDHGALTGLGDDDHPQYHTNARGDARYAPLAHTHGGYEATGTAAAAVAAHVAAPDPHPQYLTQAEGDALYLGGGQVNSDWTASSGVAQILNKPTLGTASPLNVAAAGNAAAGEVVKGDDARLTDARTPTAHGHAIADVTGLQTALDGKAATSHTHTIANVTGLQTALDAKLDDGQATAFGLSLLDDADATAARTTLGLGTAATSASTAFAAAAHVGAGGAAHADATTSVSGFMSGADKTKLNGVATGATANATDAALRDRATHTGTQLAATISDFSTAADARIGEASINALSDVVITAASTGQVIKFNGTNWINDTDATGGGGGATWGGITGTLSAQTDLQAALDAKAATGHTHAFADITAKPTTLAGYGITDGQGLDATLTALAGLNATAGLVEQTGADAFTKRAIGAAAATDIITRADGDGRYSLTGHTHGQLHDRSHAFTSSADHTATAWRVHYSNGSGVITELALGSAGQVLQSNGATAAPSFVTPSGGGGDGWTRIVLASNNVVSTTALAVVTGLSFTATASTTYLVEVRGAFQSAATTTGMNLALDIPSGTVIGQSIIPSANTTLMTSFQRADNAIVGTTTAAATAAADLPVTGWWLVVVGVTGGTVQLMQSSEIAASNTTLIGGRFLMQYRAI